MTFKEFVAWCNERACDGCWGMNTAMVCIDVMSEVRKHSRLGFRRERFWRENFESDVLEQIVNPINEKIEKVKRGEPIT